MNICPLAENAWYFRNSLVQANYNDLKNRIHETTEYLELFLRNLLLNENHPLQNRTLHISGIFKTDEKVNIEEQKANIEGIGMNYFIEGLQGSGKSTLAKRMSDKHPEYKVFREGDYSPIELAWCAYVSKDTYSSILKEYSDIQNEIAVKSHEENEHIIICYTQVITDIPGFHKYLEQYEIYNNRVSRAVFKNIILTRLANWNTDGNIFECSLFQNIIEDMILFQNASDAEIIAFYREIKKVLGRRNYHIVYLLSEDIRSNIDVIRKERLDDQERETWFPLMLGYFNESPYAKKNGLSGDADMLKHFSHRQELELAICKEVFPGKYTILKSKGYKDADIL